MSTASRDRPLIVLYAGSLDRLVREDLIPRFRELTGYRCEGWPGGSREWARRLRRGEVRADLLLSADAAVIEAELMRPGEECAEWYLLFATNELVLAYSASSPAAEEMRSLARQQDGWLRLLTGGYRLGRTDPEADPKGYRALFALQLAERRFGVAGLVERVAGHPHREQIFEPEELARRLRLGELDIAFTYRSQAEEEGWEYATLPDEINLGAPELAAEYELASYQCADGTRYRGKPIAYAAAPVSSAGNAPAAYAFLVFLCSPPAAEALRRHHFRPVHRLVRPRQRAPDTGGSEAGAATGRGPS